MDELRIYNKNGLRSGYTTGSCAAAAAKAASYMLLTGEKIGSVGIDTPAGIYLEIIIEDILIRDDYVSCAVKKDSGDDPDITNGILVYAKVERCDSGIEITGGNGIGIVTKPGLDQPVGEYAINSTPRRMIQENVQMVIENSNYLKGLRITLSIPKGRELAEKTFNPRMGIINGLSIIGTTGIVEPMSNKALLDTIKLELNQKKKLGKERVIITPGKIGSDFLCNNLGLDEEEFVLCSNYIGDAFDYAREIGIKEICLVGHIGKLVKLGFGARNTHSENGDGRIEELIRCALLAGADIESLKEIEQCITTDAVLDILKKRGILENTMDILASNIENTILKWSKNEIKAHFICFTGKKNSYEVLIRRD